MYLASVGSLLVAIIDCLTCHWNAALFVQCCIVGYRIDSVSNVAVVVDLMMY